MDPFSIATGCASLVGIIGGLTMRITAFVLDVRDARKDMDAVSRELSSLSLCLETLRKDSWARDVGYPEAMTKHLKEVLMNCEVVMQRISDLLERRPPGSLRRSIIWPLSSRDDVNKYRSSLETYKSTIEVALTIGSIQILSTLKRETAIRGNDMITTRDTVIEIRQNTSIIRDRIDVLPEIKQDTSDIKALIAAEMGVLKMQIAEISQSGVAQLNTVVNASLQNFLQECQCWAETLIEPFAKELPRIKASDVASSPSTQCDIPMPTAQTEYIRFHDLEQQLQSSLLAHAESRQAYESGKEAERKNLAKIEQLENDYQSAIQHVNTTELTLRRIKDELSKYKSRNTQLEAESERLTPPPNTAPRFPVLRKAFGLQ